MLVATRWPPVTRPIAPGNDGRYFPGLRVESNTPVEPYQLSDGRGDPDPNLVDVTMETKDQDSPASRMGRRHAVSNARGRGFVAILPETK
jgi:hypothetical protein